MDYKYTVDNIDFFATKEEIDEKKERIRFICSARQNNLNLILIIVDSKEIEKEIIEIYKQLPQHYILYDIYDKLKNNLLPFNDIDEYYSAWNEFNNIVKYQSTCIINCNKLRMYLDNNQKEDGMYQIYNRIFNHYRDGLFRHYNSRVSLIIPYEDYIGMLINAPDYVEYCSHINFNDCFKASIRNPNYSSLDNYLYWKNNSVNEKDKRLIRR